MRCDRCKYWKVGSGNEEWEVKGAGFGECLAVRERWRIMDEASKTIGRYKTEDGEQIWIKARVDALRVAKAYVQDGSEYRAELFTAQDFFCALFSPPPITEK